MGVDGTAGNRTESKSRGPGSTHREGTYLQLGSPAICACVWLCDICSRQGACICRLRLINLFTHNTLLHLNAWQCGSRCTGAWCALWCGVCAARCRSPRCGVVCVLRGAGPLAVVWCVRCEVPVPSLLPPKGPDQVNPGSSCREPMNVPDEPCFKAESRASAIPSPPCRHQLRKATKVRGVEM